MKRRQFSIAASTVLFFVFPARGHRSPDQVAEALSERIEADGASVRLLTDRAYEHQSLGNWPAAVADFRAAIELEPRSRFAIIGCAEALLHTDDWPQADAMAQRGLALDENAASQAPFHALRARVFSRQHRWLDALEAWRGALRSPHPEIDWFLGEAECLARLARHPERVEALAQSMTRNPSIVLRRAWIRALVDAGEFEVAFREIDRGMSKARWKSSWLLLRARIHGETQDIAEQKMDAMAAWLELRNRVRSALSDPYLVKDAAWALGYLGERDQALAYVKKARLLGVPEMDLLPIEQTIRNNAAALSN